MRNAPGVRIRDSRAMRAYSCWRSSVRGMPVAESERGRKGGKPRVPPVTRPPGPCRRTAASMRRRDWALSPICCSAAFVSGSSTVKTRRIQKRKILPCQNPRVAGPGLGMIPPREERLRPPEPWAESPGSGPAQGHNSPGRTGSGRPSRGAGLTLGHCQGLFPGPGYSLGSGYFPGPGFLPGRVFPGTGVPWVQGISRGRVFPGFRVFPGPRFSPGRVFPGAGFSPGIIFPGDGTVRGVKVPGFREKPMIRAARCWRSTGSEGFCRAT